MKAEVVRAALYVTSAVCMTGGLLMARAGLRARAHYRRARSSWTRVQGTVKGHDVTRDEESRLFYSPIVEYEDPARRRRLRVVPEVGTNDATPPVGTAVEVLCDPDGNASAILDLPPFHVPISGHWALLPMAVTVLAGGIFAAVAAMAM